MNFLDPFLTHKGGAGKIFEYVVFHARIWATPPSPFGVRRAWATHGQTENPIRGGLTIVAAFIFFGFAIGGIIYVLFYVILFLKTLNSSNVESEL